MSLYILGWLGYTNRVPAKAKRISKKDLQRWRLIERFREVLDAEVAAQGGAGGTWEDAKRQLALADYLSLFLFGLFNPVVETMRGLCEASGLERVEQEVCTRPVSLGSFSEAQAVVDPQLLGAVFKRLVAEQPVRPREGWNGRERVVDSTVWRVLPRMTWAFWRRQHVVQNAVRLHVQFDLVRGQVSEAELTTAKVCERAQWRKMVQPGGCYIGDRNYSYDYGLLQQLQAQDSDFIVRLRNNARWVEQSSELLTAQDRAAGVTWAGTVSMGERGEGPTVRIVQILGETESIVLATTLPSEEVAAEWVAVCYRHRWQVELFFRWLKCILGCRHWLAESPSGVAVQVYLALIAAQLLVLYQGERPNRRQMEAIRFYLMGWATPEELLARLQAAKRKKS